MFSKFAKIATATTTAVVVATGNKLRRQHTVDAETIPDSRPKTIRLAMVKHSTMFSGSRPSRHPVLGDYIPAAKRPTAVYEQTLLEWVSKTTQDYQLLEFAPENLSIQIAFLRLIGFDHISLVDLNREKGTRTCFLNKLNMQAEHAAPVLVLSKEDVIASIVEFNTSRKIKSLEATISDPIAHISPIIMRDSDIIFKNHVIDEFYTLVSKLTDEDITIFCNSFLENENAASKKILFDNLSKARELCQAYCSSLENEHITRSPRQP